MIFDQIKQNNEWQILCYHEIYKKFDEPLDIVKII